MLTIRQLNMRVRAIYASARSIRHYQGASHDETHLTVSAMPSTDRPGRIFVGYTDDLRMERVND